MRRTTSIIGVALALLLTTVPAAEAASPVPGRFCKTADIGKKVATTKYGLVICKKDGDRARWKLSRAKRSLEL